MTSHAFLQGLARFKTGISGLDTILGGGFFTGGVYIVEGVPGAGKTIFANQICFHHAREGRRVLYVTLLAESHSRLLQHIQGLSFFDPSTIPEQLTYVSGFMALEDGGLKALLELVRKEIRAQNASLVILDGFAAATESATSDREFKKFVHELQVQASLGGCTFFLLSSGATSAARPVLAVHTMVDGLVTLTHQVFGVRAEREIQIQKFRGSFYLRGVHTFDISDDGIRVYPRLESFGREGSDPDATGPDRLAIGIPKLDAMMRGGVLRASTTMILGPTGVGKTMLGYRFLASATAAEKGLLCSFYETPKRALAKARSIGLDLAKRVDDGDIRLMWRSPVEETLDALGASILEGVDRLHAKRLFIDGFNAIEQASTYPERVPQFFAALGRELHARGVTTMYSAELRQIFAPQIEAPVRGISPLLENLILLRFVELRSEIHRMISILKLRDSDFDAGMREFLIRGEGLDVVDRFLGAEALLTGVAHETSPQPETSGAAAGEPARRRAKEEAKKKKAKRPRGRESRRRG